MLRKEFFLFKANRKREIVSCLISAAYGILLGFESSQTIYSENEGQSSALGYILVILLAPVATYQTTLALTNDMVTERSTKMRESLKILGLNQYVYALGHLFIKSIFSIVLSIIMASFIFVYNYK